MMAPRCNLRRINEKMKLVHVPKPEDGHRQLFENVTDKKCAIVMSVKVANFGVVKVNIDIFLLIFCIHVHLFGTDILHKTFDTFTLVHILIQFEKMCIKSTFVAHLNL